MKTAAVSRRSLMGAAGIVALVSAALTGCSQAGPSSGGQHTLALLVAPTPTNTVQWWKNLVAPFEKAHKGVHVKIQAPTTSANDVNTTLRQELAAGSPPDVILNPTPGDAKLMATFPNSSWVTQSPEAKQLQINGRQWLVGADVQAQGLIFYNKSAFAAAGITSTPTTVDELTADMQKIKAKTKYVPMDTAGDWVTSAQFQMLANGIVMKKDPNWIADRNAGKVTFANSDYNRYMTIYKSWISSGLVPSNAMGVNYNDSITAFTSGKDAMYPMGNWIVPTIDQAKKSFQVGVFPSPTFDGSPAPQAVSAADTYSVLKDSKDQADSIALVKYLVSDKSAIQKELVAEGNFRVGFAYPASPLTQQVQKILNSAPGTVVIGDGEGNNSAPQGATAKLNTLMQGLYEGKTAAQVIQAMDAWWASNAHQ